MRPPQSHTRGGRRELDGLWLEYLRHTADTGTGEVLGRSEGYVQGIREFNDGLYFECHETWEAAWHEAPYPERLFLLGLTKLAVGFAHAGRGNPGGARRLLADGLRCLDPFPARYAGLDLEALRGGVRSWREGSAQSPPRVESEDAAR